VLILRIRQAECALADGRLDEAFEIARVAEIGRHRHGQRLIGRLVRALIQRGQEHLAAGRFQPVLVDCRKAETLAGNQPEIERLRKAASSGLLKAQQDHAQDAQRLAQARQRVDEGWLSVGEQLLEQAPSADGRAEQLKQELAAVRLQTADAVAKAHEAIKRGDIEGAIDIACSAQMARTKSDPVTELLRQIRDHAVEHMRANLEQGRIDRAQSLLQRLLPLGENGSDVGELRRSLLQCHQAAECVAAGRPAEALPLLRKAQMMCPSAKWLSAAMTYVKQAAEALEELDAGPLGLSIADAAGDAGLAAGGSNDRAVVGKDHGRNQVPDRELRMPDAQGDASMPSAFVMQMDGVGSFYVFREARVTAGPISASTRPMLGLMADPNTPTVTIERTDGDYFIRSQTPVEVNGQAVTETLLADGDRIALSPRCRLKFQLPNPASTTAMLTISGSRLSRPDVRQIVLMDRDILVGPFTNNHIRTDQVSEPFALFTQNGRLLCRAEEGVSVDGRPFDPGVGLAIDKPIEIGKLSMVVARLGA